jgi:hypothetical protein
MLKVNRISSSQGGMGTTSIAIINSTRNGIPSPESSNPDKRCRIVDMESVVIFKFF